MVKKETRKPWEPGNKLPEVSIPGYRLRHCLKEDGNIWKKQQEGWVFADTVNAGAQFEGAPKQFRELVLMVLPEERAKDRDEYFRRQNEIQLSTTPAERARSQTGLGADVISEG